MSVRVEDEAIHLEGRCGAEDAEALLLAIQDAPGRTIDLTGVQRLHLAVVQILFAARVPVRGAPANAFLARHLSKLPQ